MVEDIKSGPIPAWMKQSWSDEILQKIYKDYAKDLTLKQSYDAALSFFEKAHKLQPKDLKTLYGRSILKGEIADAQGALADAVAALEIDDKFYPLNIRYCDALFNVNRLADCQVKLHQLARKYEKCKQQPINDRIAGIEKNFVNSLGKYLRPFLLKNSKKLYDVTKLLEKQKLIDTRPLWKQLREKKECDVVSILEKEEQLIHPREMARRTQVFRVMAQVYVGETWKDIYFIYKLKDDKELFLDQTTWSTPELSGYIEKQHKIVVRFVKMLHARSPLYSEREKRFPNQDLAQQETEKHLYRIQYQTRRDMFIILERIRELRAKGKIDELEKYIEYIMGDYLVLKTYRVMCRRFEFMNEVYNTLALAYYDQIGVPENLFEIPLSERLNYLFRLPSEKERDRYKPYVFGDKSTYSEPDAVDTHYIAYKKLVDRLERRSRFAKYPLERAYIYYMVAKSHLSQNKFEECVTVAKKSLQEAKSCQNFLWMVHGALLICKVNVTQKKLENTNDSLLFALKTARGLRDEKIFHFLLTCRDINQMLLQKKTGSATTILTATLTS